MNRTRHHPEEKPHHERVSHVQNQVDGAIDLHPTDVEDDCVQELSGTRRDERERERERVRERERESP